MSGIVERLRFCLRDWNGKDRFHFFSVNALLVREAADHIEQLEARVERLEGALREIAAYDDERASAHLASEGSYAMFDEPGNVEIARQALGEGKKDG